MDCDKRPAIHWHHPNGSAEIGDESTASLEIERQADAFLQSRCQHLVVRQSGRGHIGAIQTIASRRRVAAIGPVACLTLMIDFQGDRFGQTVD